jgi:hypothetical protein
LYTDTEQEICYSQKEHHIEIKEKVGTFSSKKQWGAGGRLEADY